MSRIGTREHTLFPVFVAATYVANDAGELAAIRELLMTTPFRLVASKETLHPIYLVETKPDYVEREIATAADRVYPEPPRGRVKTLDEVMNVQGANY